MKEKVRQIQKVFKDFQKSDDFLYETFNERIYDEKFGPIHSSMEDMAFIALFGKNYFDVHESFASPGSSESEKASKPILWDNKNGGYPPEKLIDGLKTNKDYKYLKY